MEEIIYKLDNSSIIKLLGGLAGVIAAIAILCFAWLKHFWKSRSEKQLEGIKGAIFKNNSTIDNLTSAYLNNFQKLQDKRIEAAEKVWEAVLEVNKGVPGVVYFAYNVLLDEELTKESLDKKNQQGSSIGSLIQELKAIESTKYIIDIGQQIDIYKPFLGDKLYLLLNIYKGFIGRCIFKLVDGYERGNVSTWKRDEATKSFLKSALTAEEMERVYSTQSDSFRLTIDLLQTKILHELRQNLSGKSLTIDTVDYLKAVEILISAQAFK